MLNYDTQNFIFDYSAIRNGDGYCSVKDPLFDEDAPCGDLEGALADATEGSAKSASAPVSRGATNKGGSRADGGAAIFSLDDVRRAELIADGWPWEDDAFPVWAIIVAVVGGLALVAAAAAFFIRRRKVAGGTTTKAAPPQL